MKIKISSSLILGEWFQLIHNDGRLMQEWIRQDDSKPQLVGFEHWSSPIDRIYFYPNACDSLGVIFLGSVRILSKTFQTCTPEFTENGLLHWDRAEEAKNIIDRFLIKAVKMKIFL